MNTSNPASQLKLKESSWRAMFWIFVFFALSASLAFAVQANAGTATSWFAALWPIVAIGWAFIAESLRKALAPRIGTLL